VTSILYNFPLLLHCACVQLAELATLIWYTSPQEVPTDSCHMK